MANILVFGASTTYGAWDSEGGWVQRLRKIIDKKNIESEYQLDYLIYNLGVSGDKSANILKRLVVETEPRLDKYGGENIFLFHFGINDTIYNHKLGRTEVTPQEFKNNYKKIITLAKKHSSKIVIVSYMPVDKRVDPMLWAENKDRSYKNEYLEKYDKIMREVAQETDVCFIEIFKKFINIDYPSLLADGVHMNDTGHKLFCDEVFNYLIEKKIIKF